ncbi:efflux RND transporter permease subunit [Methylotenera sp.]|uniref:efflux RND transporter permease subunit n=1 Tax=Methylotenera sp. TaxID=2051956 RepID=UPI0027374E7A|nr:efflux RND transporter permease subunit [Methylotenera sp.]MDP3004652.1 efflux RND transporter permease subunit [Methylotenera sp.]
MIERIIRWSAANRLMVLLVTLLVTAWGVFAMLRTPLDAIPDLSDTQVIIRTQWPGQAPQIVENQLTYPLTTTMLSVPGVKTVRGYSLFGDSYVYILFNDGTDQYWARSRVLEYLSQIAANLPAGVSPSLGPDATGVGWIYEYALVDRSGKHDLGELRALQDWFLKFELKTIPDVSEVATLGGMVRQYQVQVDPDKLRNYRIPLSKVVTAIKDANQETGGAVVELAEAEYMVRAHGYLESLDDFRHIPIKVSDSGTPILLSDVARIQIGPELRRGIAELNGEGEVVGGIIVLRSGRNALKAIDAVKAKLATLKKSLPPGVEIVTTYDRSQLIKHAVDNLTHKLIEEFIVVALVCALFLWHIRSALVAIVALPLGVLMSFIVMYHQGINANIMSLGGIAIAIGAMVDAAIVMIENAHRKLDQFRSQQGEPNQAKRVALIIEAASEVGPALFFSLLIITLSFIPVFTLEAQEGKLFAPLAFTKTYAMAAAAGLSVTLVPVLMTFFIRGRIRSEHDNPLNRWMIALYRPLLGGVLRHPKTTLIIALCAVLLTLWPLSKLGSEFMPPLNEGDLLYMPTALPGLSAAKASEILQLTNRLIKTVPEVKTVFGKAGRAETATDPAPLEMLETTIQLKDRAEWRPGMTPEKLVAELDARLKIPGMANVWVQPIRNRIDMLSTGIKSPVGIKIAGPDLATLERLGVEVERIMKQVPGAGSVIAERVTGGRYIDVKINRLHAARYGLSIADVQSLVSTAIGGDNVAEKVDGLARYPINVRFPRELRDSIEKLKALPIINEKGATVPLGTVAEVTITDGPPMIKSENARPNVWVYVDIHDRDLGSFVHDAKATLDKELQLPAGYSLAWSGQFEYFERAAERLSYVVPMTLGIIFILLFMAFKRITPALLILGTLPFALVGAVWFLYLLGHHFSIASGVGMIALAGLSAEFGIIMLVYLDDAIARYRAEGRLNTLEDWHAALMEGAVLRVRPKAMTVAVILAGLMPILLGTGTGSETMSRIAAPMVGGMLTAPLLSLLVLPAAYVLLRRTLKVEKV